jgi:hypothetical protein
MVVIGVLTTEQVGILFILEVEVVIGVLTTVVIGVLTTEQVGILFISEVEVVIGVLTTVVIGVLTTEQVSILFNLPFPFDFFASKPGFALPLLLL